MRFSQILDFSVFRGFLTRFLGINLNIMWKILIFLLFFVKISLQSEAELGFDNELCDRQLAMFREALASPRMDWAVTMFDYWGKIQSGLTVGNTANFGHYDECIRFLHDTRNVNVGMIQGQYCMINHRATVTKNDTDWNENFDWREVGAYVRSLNLNLRSGICIPASCSALKAIEFANEFLTTADLLATSASCDVKDRHSINGLDVFAIVLFSLFLVVVAASTIYEIYATKNSKSPSKLLSSFSFYTNGYELFDIQKDKSASSINSMHGVRALSVLWVVMGHRRFFHLIFALTNANEVNNWLENIRTVIFQTDHLAVDSFFVMGGLLVVLSFIKDLEKRRASLWRMYLRRYLRYTPLLAIIILFQVTLLKFVVSGPTYNWEGQARNCQTNWWGALLHIQNYLDWTKMCVGHSWYLSADFQLFLVSPLFIFAIWKLGRKLLWMLPLISFITVVYIFLMAYFYEVPVFYLKLNAETSEIFHRFIYFPTHARMGPWFIGMTTGYLIYKNRIEKFKLPKIFFTIMWIIALSTIFAVILGFYPFMQMNNNTTTVFQNAFYLATFRNAFACGVAWIIFGCENGTGGVVRWFLSWPHWQPISRMGLSVYLIHPIYQSIVIFGQNQPIHFDEITFVHAYFGDILVVLVLSTVLYLTFEVSFANIENYFSKRKTS
ncbi:hypothetical protein ACKWTF_014911 [Chironomus riparius]